MNLLVSMTCAALAWSLRAAPVPQFAQALQPQASFDNSPVNIVRPANPMFPSLMNLQSQQAQAVGAAAPANSFQSNVLASVLAAPHRTQMYGTLTNIANIHGALENTEPAPKTVYRPEHDPALSPTAVMPGPRTTSSRVLVLPQGNPGVAAMPGYVPAALAGNPASQMNYVVMSAGAPWTMNRGVAFAPVPVMSVPVRRRRIGPPKKGALRVTSMPAVQSQEY
jgi:hypothetical protein